LSENRTIYENVGKNSATGQATAEAYALHARYLTLQTPTQNM